MENNRIALLRSVTPASSPLPPSIQRPLLVTAARSLTNLQLQPSSSSPQSLSARMDNPLLRRDNSANLSRAATRPTAISSLSPHMSRRPTPSARISLAHSPRSNPFGPRQLLPSHLMSLPQRKKTQCIHPTARLTSLPTAITQPSTSSALPERHTFNQTDYEVPEKNRITMRKLIHQKHGLSIEYGEADHSQQQVKMDFFTSRDNLLINATTQLPNIFQRQKRPAIPDLAINDSPHTWIKKIYKNADGMVLGEFHGDSGSKKFLIKNMSFLKRHGTNTLYMEHLLTDMHQNELDLFFSSRTKTIPPGLKNHLECLDKGFGIRSKYNFLKLVKSAKDNGIEVKALDAAASYHINKGSTDKNCRISMMNYYAQGVINDHQEKHHGKWVALVGNQHVNTFETIPGLAELTAGIGIRVKETHCKTNVIQPDKGEISLSASSSGPHMTYNFIKSDFVLMTPAKKDLNGRLSETEINKRLKTGDFTLDTERSMLKHRSRDGSVVNTPLNRDAEGNWFVSKPDWKRINNKPYRFIQDLIKDLEGTMNMKLVYSL
ncbi:membrane-targeted effector domain-containing toxin [Pantoea sp. App145]|uniref:membrane-targeted effector domain-containing toxin n=1 Tax=Pantoea sp. App145 TaxID=3071567 RepID=UPI003A7FD024